MEIKSTRAKRPPRILIHAEHGVGKSTLAASAPDPIFIQAEDGLSEIDAVSFPLCKSFNDIMAQLRFFYTEKLEYKTLVIDSLDWCEKLIYDHVRTIGGKKSISDFSYGSGYQLAFDSFCHILKALDVLREAFSINIILIAHTSVQKYENPLGENFDMFKIKLREKNASLFLEWCDLIGFLHTKTFITKKKEGFKDSVKATGGVERVLSCYHSAGWSSKSRYTITEDLDIDLETGINPLLSLINK